MKGFLKALFLFLLPPAAVLAVFAWADPFQFFRAETDAARRGLKRAAAHAVDPRLGKWIDFTRDPAHNVVLGDSRGNRLDAGYFEELMGEPVRNLAYGAGSLPEILATFREVRKREGLRRLFVGINFDLYNGANGAERFTGAVRLSRSPLLYLASRDFFRASLLYLQASMLHRPITVGKPSLTKDGFWRYQLESSAAIAYRIYDHPAGYQDGLEDMAGWCEQSGVRLVFFIPPTHVDLQKRIADFGLEDEAERFRNDLSALADLYDFDYPNAVTTDRDCFVDPYHCTEEVARMVVRELATGEARWARFTARGRRAASLHPAPRPAIVQPHGPAVPRRSG